MPMLADQVDAVIGVDTHHDTHTASIVTPLGAELVSCVNNSLYML